MSGAASLLVPQDGKPLVLSPDDLAKLKATPKERVAAALDAQGERGEIVKIAAPIYRLRGGKIPRQAGKVHPYPTLDKAQYKGELVKELIEKIEGQAGPSTRYEHSLGTTGLATSLLGQLNAPQRRIATALGKLNEEGQEKAAERVEELTEIPRYQVQEPPTAPPQDPPAPQEGKDTTSPADSPQRAQELPTGPSVIVLTMVCPLCARKITGNPVTKTAYCPNCKKSFPLPQE